MSASTMTASTMTAPRMPSPKTAFRSRLAAVALATAAMTLPAQADQVFMCEGSNAALHFVVYENNGQPTGGHMYVSGLQTAVLDVKKINQWTVHARVSGNTADTYFTLNNSRNEIYVNLGNTQKALCNARVMQN